MKESKSISQVDFEELDKMVILIVDKFDSKEHKIPKSLVELVYPLFRMLKPA